MDKEFVTSEMKSNSVCNLKTQIMGIALLCAGMQLSGKEKPNVIYILTDQWRSSAFGYAGDTQVKTPNIDNFSRESVIFRNCVSVCPLSGPYRASLMTGRFPTSTGMFVNDIYLPEKELCMAEIFKSAGYCTAYYGKWHIDGHGRYNYVQPYRRQGFDYWKATECSHEYNHMPYYENDDVNIKYWEKYSPFAIEEDVENYLEHLSKERNPFLLFVSFATPHFSKEQAPEQYQEMYPMSELKLRENVEDKFSNLRKELQNYYAHCTATDKAVGDLIKKIKELGLFDNTIIIFTSDHGDMMGSHGVRPREKQFAWDESTLVPFLIRYPGIGENAGKETITPLCTPDILPTMLSLANINIPGCIEGEDLSSAVKNPDRQKDRPALYMSVFPTATTPFSEYRAIKTLKYTYVKTPGKATMLFDNVNDPYQMNNLIDKPESKEIQRKMDRLLSKKLKQIGDADFKPSQYYLEKFGFGFLKTDREVPYNVTPGKISLVVTPQKNSSKCK